MTDKQAQLLWEDVLNNGNGNNVINKFRLPRDSVRVFLSYTKPEMFVSKEINEQNLLEIKELQKKYKMITNAIRRRKISSLMFSMGFILYIVITLPVVALIVFIKYVF